MNRVAERTQRGFTLIELSIVLLIVGLLLAGGVNMLSSSTDSARYKESSSHLQEVRNALMAYYTQFQRLPCPDTDADGIENPPGGGVCTSPRGWLPHVTLGIGDSDAWGERIRYVVNGAFTDAAAVTNFCTTGAAPFSRSNAAWRIQVQDTAAVPQTMGDWAGFALISTGKNGRATNSGMATPFDATGGCAALNALETENCDNDSILRTGTPLSDNSVITFDDTVVWVGDMQLIAELRKAGACTVAAAPPPAAPPAAPTLPGSGTGDTGTGTGDTGTGTGTGDTGTGTGTGDTGAGTGTGTGTGTGDTGAGSGSGNSGNGNGNGNAGGNSGGEHAVCRTNADDRAKCNHGCNGFPQVGGSCNVYSGNSNNGNSGNSGNNGNGNGNNR